MASVFDVLHDVAVRLTVFATALSIVVTPTLSFAQQAPAAGTVNIVPSGRTATQVQTVGTTTNITTSTVSGPNAFNSFSHFQTGAGTTANLQLPSGARNLVNLVHDSAINIHGIVNSYQNGQIGGNVYFASPHGMIVGRGGVINTGSLHVSTPTREFMDSVISPSGQIGGGAVNQLMSGDFPLSPNGHISIRGRVNAADGVRLIGQSVAIGSGRTPQEAAHVGHAARFAASVNSKGMRVGSGIAVRNGSIHIVAADTARVNGRLAARGRNGNNGGEVTVRAKNIDVGARTRVTSAASKTAGNAGNITFFADNNLKVASGASFNASSSRGNAGTIELSAKNKVELANAIYDLSAPNGKAGTLLIDPTDIVINGSNSMTTNGGNVLLQATNSITVASNGTIDTRQRTAGVTSGDSGNVTIEAPHITVDGSILAGIDAGALFNAGNVSLLARHTHQVPAGKATASASIDINGAITGRTIELKADAQAISSYLGGLGPLVMAGSMVVSGITGVNVGYVHGDATATVNINTGARLEATDRVVIEAKGKQEATVPTINLGAGIIFPGAAAVVVGMIAGRVEAKVNSGATIVAKQGLSVTAANEAKLSVTAVSISTNGVKVNTTAAISEVDVNTSALVASGATLTVGGNVDVIANNKNNFSTSASATALGNASAGVAFSYSDISSSATARLGASVGSLATPVGNVRIEGTSFNEKNSSSASVTVGNPALVTAVLDLANEVGSVSQADFINKLFNSAPGQSGSTAVPKFGSAISIISSNISANAAIVGDGSGSIPTVNATNGNVSVISDVHVRGARSLADSSINSEGLNPTASNPSATTAFSAGVAIGTFTHNSNAYIGPGVTVRAQNVAVAANTIFPITNTWTQWAGLPEVLSHLNGNLGVVNNILTSYANATASSTNLSLAGSFNYLSLDNTTTAWIASNTRIEQPNAPASVAPATWTATLYDASTRTFDRGVNVHANTNIATINIDGNMAPIFPLGNDSQGSAVGGSLGLFMSTTRTIAGIASNATVSTADKVSVFASSHDTVVGLAPSSGKAAGTLALSGVGTVSAINNITHASISDGAEITAPTVDISATQAMSVISLSAAFSMSKEAAVGLSLSLLFVNTDTAAYIGNNHPDIVGTNPGADLSVRVANAGHVQTHSLNVAAVTSGRLFSVAAAAAVTDPTPSPPRSAAEKLAALGSVLGLGGADAAVAAGKAAASQSAGGVPTPSVFSLDVAGAASVSQVDLATRASISDATIEAYPTITGVSATVSALNNTIMANASGSAAISMAASVSSNSAAVAGAISVGLSGGRTTAFIERSSINDATDVAVSALAGGQQTVVGMGMTASPGVNVSISASVAVITDSVAAYIDDSTLIGRGSATGRGVAVNAYQSTEIGIGGGSLYVGGKGGGGLAITYAEIADPSGAYAVDAHMRRTAISSFDTIDVIAVNSARIIAAAAAGGGGATVGMAGSFVISHITPTISASIDSDGTFALPPNISVTGDIRVLADSGSVSAFNTVLADVVRRTNNNNAVSNESGIDFTANDINDGDSSNAGVAVGPGAMIVSVAGMVQVGQSNVGFALVQNTISQTHSATFRRAQVTAGGDIHVVANDGSTLLGVAVGVGAGTGQFAGLASTVVNLIDNQILAQVGSGGNQTSLSGRNITVQATNSSAIRGAAGTLGLGIGGAAAGLAFVYDSIAGSVTAEVNGARLVASQSVMVDARSTAHILTVALGIAVSRDVGIAGSVATSILSTNVTADIRNDADVVAAHNVGVTARNANAIEVIAGAAGVGAQKAGVGISVVANQIGGSTTAYIDDSDVDARGQGGTFNVNSGTLSNGNFDLTQADDPGSGLPNLGETQRAVRGMAVVATSEQAIVANAVSLGMSFQPFVGDAAAITVVNNAMGGATRAYATNARLDARLTTAATGANGPEIYIGASSQTYSRNLVIAGAGGGGFAGAGAVSSTQLNRTTQAYMTGNTVGSTVSDAQTVGNVAVNAQSNQVSNNVAIGLAIGFGAGAATILTNQFAATTEAYVDRGTLSANGLQVTAKSVNGFFAAAGAGSAGIIGIAGAFVVGTSSNTTRAYIGSSAQNTAINLGSGSGLTVSAVSDNTFTSYSIGGALGGAAAVAGMLDVTLVSNTTEARLERATGTQSGDMTVTATETVSIDPTTGAGALATSGAGVGAGVNVVQLKSRVAAIVLNSTLSTTGDVLVAANAVKDIDMMTATVGAGKSVGIGAAISVLLIGTTAPADAEDQIAGSVAASDTANSTQTGNGVRRPNTPGANQTQPAPPPSVSVASSLGSANSSVTSEITGGSTTARNVTVTATSRVSALNVATGVGAGSVGVGAAVAYSRLNETVTASLTGNVTANAATVTANMQNRSGHALDVRAYAGAGGLFAGVGAAVADAREMNTVTARMGGTFTGNNSGAVNVTAGDSSSLSANAVGAVAGGGAALGTSSATIAKNSTVNAQLDPSSTVANYNALTIAAASTGTVAAAAQAGVGGLGVAGVGAGASASDTSVVTALVGHDSNLTIGSGDILIAADATPQVFANALGVAASAGAGVGASVALASVSTTTTAKVEDDVTVRSASSGAPDLTVRARNIDPGSARSAEAVAIAGTGGFSYGINATVSTAENTSRAIAQVGNDLTLGTTAGSIRIGAVSIAASNTTDQYATTTGVAAGALAVGFNTSRASSNSTTTATLGNLGAVNAASLNVSATGVDTNYASSVAGTGGVIAGNAASSTTSSISNTTASIGSSDATHFYNLSGGLTVVANHTTNFDGTTDSVNASLVGGSGAFLRHNVNNTVSVSVADNARIRANHLTVTAYDTVSHLFSNEGNPDAASWKLNSGSGGLLNLPAARLWMDVVQNTSTTLGNNQNIHILAPGSGNSTFLIEARNNATVHDKARLDSGGVIAIADLEAKLNVTQTATLAIGRSDNTQSTILLDIGDVKVGAWSNANLELRVVATTYGLAGEPSGRAYINYTGTSDTDIHRNTRIESTFGGLTIAAGTSPDGLTRANITANAVVDLWNKTARPIYFPPDPRVNVVSNASVDIASSGAATNAGIRSAGDMAIYSDRGNIVMNANGTGKDIYRESIAAVLRAIFGADITFDYKGGTISQSGVATAHIDGIVLTGIQRTRFLTISYINDPALQYLLIDTNGVSHTLQNGVTVSTTILVRLAQLQNLLSQYAADPIAAGAYNSEILFLKQKLVAMGLASGDPSGTNPNNPFVIGAWAQNVQQAYANLQRTVTFLGSSMSGITSNVALVQADLNGYMNASGSVQNDGSSMYALWGPNREWDMNRTLLEDTLGQLMGFSKWASQAANSQARTDFNFRFNNAQGLAGLINGGVQQIAGYRSQLDGVRTSIAGVLVQIQQHQQIINSPASSQAALDAAYLGIRNQLTQLNAQINLADSLQSNITSASAVLKGNVATFNSEMAQAQSRLLALRDLAYDPANASDKNTHDGSTVHKLFRLHLNITVDAVAFTNSINEQHTNAVNAENAFGNPSSAAPVPVLGTNIFLGGHANGVVYNQSLYTTRYSEYDTHSAAVRNASSNLSGNAVRIGDTVATLGDLSIRADRLTGLGQLRAPGDAQINITNNTASVLQVGNLTIDSDSGGHLRFNGVLIQGQNRTTALSQINALNKGGAVANFGTIETARTQVALGIFPSISITSNFQPGTTPVPTGVSQTGFLPAPDIVLMSGGVINNALGSVNIKSEAGNIYSNGQINANTVTILVKNGDFVQSYVFGFFHGAGDPAGTGLNGGDPSGDAAGGGIVANGSVYISARYLNINGLIQSGIDQWNLTLPQTPTLTGSAAQFGIDLTTAIGLYQVGGGQPVTLSVPINGQSYNYTYAGVPGQINFGIDFAEADHGRPGGSQITNALYQLSNPGSNMTSYYDAANNRYQVDATKVLGGYVQLYGQIMNTSPNVGRIRVLDGFGQININNQSNRDVYLSTLDTGLDPSGVGRGIQGKIDITNVSVDSATNVVSAVRTIYTRNTALNRIDMITINGTLNSVGEVVGSTVVSVASGPNNRTTSYTLPAGLRYVYTTGTDQSTITYLEYSGTQLFGSSTLTVDSSISFDHVDGPHTLSVYRIANGTYIKTDVGQDGSAWVQTSATHANAPAVYVKTAEWTSCNWWTICIAQDHHMSITKTEYNTVVTTNSLKANYPIAIQFGGSDSGAININSPNANVLLNGAVNNKTGATAITGRNIVQNNSNALISSQNISLTATNGSVGTLGGGANPSVPVRIDLTNGGSLAASATQGNVVVSAVNDLKFSTIAATGNSQSLLGRVVLSAGNNIVALNAGSYIEGQRIELATPNGQIGAAAAPVTVRLGYDDTSAGFKGYLGLKATAANDIHIQSASWAGNANADMLLDTVASLGGNVVLTTAGRIIDNNPIQSIDSRTYNQLLSYWTSLGLLENSQGNQDRRDAAIATFQASRTADYRTYWQLRTQQANGGTTYDPTFQYVANAAERSLLTQQFESQGIPAGQIAGKIADYETSRTTQYRALHSVVGSYTAAYDAGFRYSPATVATAASEQAALLSGSSWTERQLALSLSAGALKTITGTNPILKVANVSGQTVTLNAGRGLGQSLQSLTIDSTNITSSQDLTEQQKIALAVAERGDFIDNANPNIVEIRLKQPVNFGAVNALNVAVTAAPVLGQPDLGAAYLASLGDAILNNISVSGDLRVKVRGSIVNASISNDPTVNPIIANSVIFEAANGAIGRLPNLSTGLYDDRPLRIALRPNSTLVARAQGGIDIITVSDMLIDTVYSPGNIVLTSTAGSLLNANNDLLINVLGTEVKLVATNGTVGAPARALNVGNNIAGGVSVEALGLVNLYGPQNFRLAIKSLETAADVVVTAALDVSVEGIVRSAGRVEFDVAGQLLLAAAGQLISTAAAVEVNTSFGTLPASSNLVMTAGSQVVGATGVRIVTGSQTVLADVQATTGAISVNAGGDFSIVAASQVAAIAGLIDVIANSIMFAQNSTATAATTVGLQSTQDTIMGSGSRIAAGTGVSATVGRNATLTDVETTTGGITANVTGSFDLAAAGRMAAVAGPIAVTANSIMFGQNSTTTAATTVGLQSTQDTTMGSGSRIAAGTGVSAMVGRNATLTDVETTTGGIIANVTGSFDLAAAGRMAAVAGPIAVTANSVMFGQNSTTTAATTVGLQSVQDTIMGNGSRIIAGTGLTATAGRNATLTDVQATTGGITATVTGSFDLAAAGRMAAIAGPIAVTANSIMFGQNSTTTAATTGGLQSAQDTIMGSGSRIAAGTGVTATVGRNATLTDVETTAGGITANVTGSFDLAAAGRMAAVSGPLAVTANSINMGRNSRMTAATIGLQATRDITLGALIGTANPAANAAPVITVTAGGPTLAGAIISNNDGQTNITTTRPNASIRLVAGGGIGVNSVLNPPGTPSALMPISVNVPLLSASTTRGDINIRGRGDLRVLSLTTPDNTNVTTTGAFAVDSISGTDVVLNAPGDINLGTVVATSSVNIGATSVTGNIVHTSGSGPLIVNVTGANGGIAQNVTLNIDAPLGTQVGDFFAVDATIATNSTNFDISTGFVPGKLVLTMPAQTIVLDNRSPVPTSGPSVQMYGPDTYFNFGQNGYTTVTNNYIVSYNTFAAVTALNVFAGMSFVRDIPRDLQSGEPIEVQTVSGKTGSTFYIIGMSPAFMLEAMQVPKAVDKTGDGPAVNY